MNDIDNIVKTLRSVADYLIAVHATADELRGHGLPVSIDLDGCLDRAEQLQNAPGLAILGAPGGLGRS